MAMELQGKICVVTGGGGGIGREIADVFARAGGRVYAIDRMDFTAAHPGVQPVLCDLRDAGAIAAFFGRLTAEAGRLDVLVNNAATITRRAALTDITPDEWDEALAVNLTAVFHMCRLAIPLMPAGGSIINMASQLASVATKHGVTYSATKGALVSFSRGLAIEMAERRVRVNTLSPGAVATERVTHRYDSAAEAEAALGPLHLLNRLGRPEEIAQAALFLASDRASFMTGSDMLVDGGYCAR